MISQGEDSEKRGRKKICDCTKKQQINIMVEGCDIDALGGKKKVQMIASAAISLAIKSRGTI